MQFKRQVLAASVAFLCAAGSAQAAIQDMLDDNFDVEPGGEAITDIYPTAAPFTPGDATGYLVIDEKEDVVAPGIEVYDQGFRSGDTTFNGCIMAKKDIPPLLPGELPPDTCKGDPDSGKRFKLRNYGINEPIDIQFNVSTVEQELPLLYAVYGKLTNENDGTFEASGFKVELGTGIGANFAPSTDTDGVSLVTYQDFVGKYPGGLFGGSPAEGLPFFSTESAFWLATQEGDALTTTGVPTQYSDLFGLWQPLDRVPPAWLFDNDGRMWTDGKLQAYLDGGTWYTYKKVWSSDNIALVLEDFTDANNQDPIAWALLPDDLNPLPTVTYPDGNPFVDLNELTAWMNDEAGLTGTDAAIRTQQVVEALLQFLDLVREEVPQATLDAWAAQPVTVKYSADETVAEPTPDEAALWPLVATWDQSLGDEGYYVMDAAYANNPAFTAALVDGVATDLTETLGDGTVVVSAENMALVVKDNTGANTDFFGIPGYFEDVIEDLSNVNTFYAIQVDPTAAPAGATPFTLRITLTGSGVPVDPDDPNGDDDDSSSGGGGGGCSVGGDGRLDPTLPALLAAALGLLGWRRYKASH